jgi:2-amino-4-hydroxy-6-hydroxymethyldihydropteridine diphosphokinase/dihydropteroate synthase
MIALGLGSNENSSFGTSAQTLREALRRLSSGRDPLITNVRPSRVYQSHALLPPGAPNEWNKPYLNMAVLAETKLAPLALLGELKALERVLGRTREEKWAPRPLDLDLLFWENVELNSETLTLPHPEILKRPFVTTPLSDLIEDLRLHKFQHPHPVQLDAWATRTVLGPALVGILNLTPDSFSDGGRYNDVESAINFIKSCADAGCEVIDLGAESTRPGAHPVSESDEIERLKPFLKLWKSSLSKTYPNLKLSIDTRNLETAKLAIEFGAHWINDVMGAQTMGNAELAKLNNRDLAFAQLIKNSQTKYVIMHSLDVPVVKFKTLPHHEDPVKTVYSSLTTRCELLLNQGLRPDQIIIDTGIGFGKSAEQSLELLFHSEQACRFLPEIKQMIGHSRKSFLKSEIGFSERDPETQAISLALAPHTLRGIDFLRVHEIDHHERMLRSFYTLWKPYPTLTSFQI